MREEMREQVVFVSGGGTMRFRGMVLTAASLAAGSSLVALLIGTQRSDVTMDAGGYAFSVFIAAFAALPYGLFLLMNRSHSNFIQRLAMFSFGLYVTGDVVIRLRVFLFPGSSTDAVALVTYPIVGTVFALLVGAAIAKLWSHTLSGRMT